MEYDDVLNLVLLELRYDTMLTPKQSKDNAELTCYAYVKNKNGICRCARGQTVDTFCKTHHKQFVDGTLAHGCFKNDVKLTTQDVKKITINKVEYYLEPLTQKLYSIPKSNSQPNFVGYLQENENEELIINKL